jgi:hypothetical protein
MQRNITVLNMSLPKNILENAQWNFIRAPGQGNVKKVKDGIVFEWMKKSITGTVFLLS